MFSIQKSHNPPPIPKPHSNYTNLLHHYVNSWAAASWAAGRDSNNADNVRTRRRILNPLFVINYQKNAQKLAIQTQITRSCRYSTYWKNPAGNLRPIIYLFSIFNFFPFGWNIREYISTKQYIMYILDSIQAAVKHQSCIIQGNFAKDSPRPHTK